ncbi:MAG: glycosyltransferase family 4 protein [Actinomycetota bacterium]
MRLLVLCPHFTPDLHAATGEVMSGLVEAFAARGHEVDVVTSLPWYRRHDVEPEWRGRPWRIEATPWGRVARVWPFPTRKTNVVGRAMGFVGFSSLVTATALRLGRPDAVLAMSPPFFLGDAGWVVARRWGVPLVYNVQDIFPDVAIELGALTNPAAIAAARAHERALYRRADAVTVLSEDQAANVAAKIGPAGEKRVHVIPNVVDLSRIEVGPRRNPYRDRHGFGAETIVMYSGNVGLSQPFELVAIAARALAGRTDVRFVINGEGAARPDVDLWAAPMDNVSVVDFAPRHEVSDVLAAGDIHLILLRSGLSRSSTPSKLYASLASGRPILASIDEGSDVATTVKQAGAGVAVAPDDPVAFIDALTSLLDHPAERQAMGGQARRFAETWLSPEHQAARYEDLFDQLLRSTNRRAPNGTIETMTSERTTP